jgi:hypothetical protein
VSAALKITGSVGVVEASGNASVRPRISPTASTACEETGDLLNPLFSKGLMFCSCKSCSTPPVCDVV